MSLFSKILRAGEGKKLRALQGIVPDIDALEPATQKLTDTELRAKTDEFRGRLEKGEDLDDLLVEAFAVVREAGVRILGQRHYPVQLMGGAALHFGWVAEMKTGEGKTLVSTLPVYLNGLSGDGVHVISVNDYLVTRDSEWMGAVHRFLGLDIGLIIPGRDGSEYKRAQYSADVTYGTNNEFGFDYLRDNMAQNRAAQVQRGHNYAIVDEVDSILIDEARTPLIISGRMAEAAKLYVTFAEIVQHLKRDVDYEVDEEKRIVSALEPGIEKVEQRLGVDNLYDQVSSNLVHQMSAALRAKELYRRDKDYVIQGGEIKIVDEFTGRILDGRRWSEGLHQAVEAKEGVKIKEENQTLATITLQNYFRLYDKIAGMTGTATTEAAEFSNTYGMDVVPIPTNRDLARLDQADLIFKSEHAKYQAVADDIEERIETGQPVLVGTVSVAKSEELGDLLRKRGIQHEVLNAKQHHREADIIVQAGRIGAVTVATNMAGRGVDIQLGGNPEGMASAKVRAENLDPATEDGQARFAELLPTFEAQCQAEGDEVREAGGLYVLGTERHDSRRIDNQLRGRAGRQGDAGESRFYLSLEDELMRLFATGAMNWVMGKALPDDVPIEAKMVTNAIERAQSTVEQRNAETRKNVLKYDEVMNEQRKVIYTRRDQILDGTDLRAEALEYLAQAVDAMVAAHCVSDVEEEWDLEALVIDVTATWPTEVTVEQLGEFTHVDDIISLLISEGEERYTQRETELGEATMREVERQVMLRIVDQRWREHLYEMDYLKEGINLRAMGQRDPLTEWQREGFEMFGEMVGTISRDFVKYVMHVQVVINEPAPKATDVQESGPADSQEHAPKAATSTQLPSAPPASRQRSRTPVVKSASEKIGRNDPCHCGSGKKYKQCHGKAGL
ncbi:preprotein translocase subunit SecA [Acidimicrobiaceae bacterium AH-315-P05]|nr:preprotein translocase subunit SecA [Acidimicrobiaceae bacterium AH-315-P05]